MYKVAIYWDDLTPEKQAELLALWGDNGNYDVIPFVEFDMEDEEDHTQEDMQDSMEDKEKAP